MRRLFYHRMLTSVVRISTFLVVPLVFALSAPTAAAGADLTWATEVLVSANSALGQYTGDVAVLSNGTAVVVYSHTSTPGDSDIALQMIDRDGNRLLPADLIVNQDTTDTQNSPTVAVNSSGYVMVVWNANKGAPWHIWAQLLDPGLTPLWGATDLMVDQGVNSEYSPDVGYGGGGMWVVAWAGYRVNTMDIWAMKLNETGARQWGGGDLQVSLPSLNNQNGPSIAITSSNEAFIAWRDLDVGDAYGQLLSPGGARLWSAGDVRLNQNTTGEQDQVSVVSSGSDLYVAWRDTRNGDSDVYGQRFDSSGAAQWGPDDVRMTVDQVFDQYSPRLALDTTRRAGELLVTWENCGDVDCNGSNATAQRILSTGSHGWASDVRLNTRTGGYHGGCAAAFDPGSSQFYIVWTESDGLGGADVYVQRADESGAIPEFSVALSALAPAASLVAAWAVIDRGLRGRGKT